MMKNKKTENTIITLSSPSIEILERIAVFYAKQEKKYSVYKPIYWGFSLKYPESFFMAYKIKFKRK